MNDVLSTVLLITFMFDMMFGKERSNLDLLEPYTKFHGSKLKHRQIRECQSSKYGHLTHELHSSVKGTLPEPYSIKTKYFTKKYDGRMVKGHYTIVPEPLLTVSVLEPLRAGGCRDGITETVDVSGKQRNCYIAMNAGFFNTTTGKCLGNIVSDGRRVADSKGIQNAQFGITQDGNIFTGYLSEEDLKSQKFQQLVSGVVWILRNNEIYIAESQKIECSDTQETGSFEQFVNVTSARSSVGHDAQGRVILLHIDGKTYSEGVNLWEMAVIMKDLGAVNAINMDGGGSSTYVVNGTIVNYPSDQCSDDNSLNCARSVTTILCIHEPDCVEKCTPGSVCRWGKCECQSPWTGPSCSFLPCHLYNCSGQGQCTIDGCKCNVGWIGTNCDQRCAADTWGPNCSLECLCQNGASCNNENGLCDCLPGYTGHLCELMCFEGWFGKNCSKKCSCQSSCSCHHVNGSCENLSTVDFVSEFTECVVQRAIRIRHLVPDQPGQHRIMVAAVVTTSIAAAVSLIFAISVLCCRWRRTGDRFNSKVVHSSPVHYKKYVDDSSDVSISDNEGS